MNPGTLHRVLAAFVLLFGLAFLPLLAPACRSPLDAGPGVHFVEASRAAHTLWGARLVKYLEADATLDPLLRDQLVKGVQDWEIAIEAAEEAVRPDGVAPLVPPPTKPADPQRKVVRSSPTEEAGEHALLELELAGALESRP